MKRYLLVVMLCLLLCSCAMLDRAVPKIEKAADTANSIIQFVDRVIPTPVTDMTATVATGAIGLLTTLLGFYKKYRADTKIKTIVEGVDKAKSEVEGGKYAEAFDTVLRNVAVAQNLYPEIKADVLAIRKKAKALKV